MRPVFRTSQSRVGATPKELSGERARDVAPFPPNSRVLHGRRWPRGSRRRIWGWAPIPALRASPPPYHVRPLPSRCLGGTGRAPSRPPLPLRPPRPPPPPPAAAQLAVAVRGTSTSRGAAALPFLPPAPSPRARRRCRARPAILTAIRSDRRRRRCFCRNLFPCRSWWPQRRQPHPLVRSPRRHRRWVRRSRPPTLCAARCLLPEMLQVDGRVTKLIIQLRSLPPSWSRSMTGLLQLV